jgi:hypothetical protein
MKNCYFIILNLIFLWGCVSVQLPSSKDLRSKNVQFKTPQAPFKDFATTQSDRAWISEKTGNTISFLSQCGNQNDPSIEQIENESLSSLSHLVGIKGENFYFNERNAKFRIHRVVLDGVAVQVALIIFKKNGCDYTLSYGGIEEKFKIEEQIFNQFTKNFKIP